MLPEDAIAEALRQVMDSIRQVGTVTGTSGVRVIVNIKGSVLTLPRIAAYTPVVGDVVTILGPAPYLVLGKTA